MKKGQLRFIPLQADLCLNKQKVDIENFKGWQKCNAPVYGGCLSPLYTTKDGHHDLFIGNDKYDYTNGALKKNNITIWDNAVHKLTKTKVSADYDALALTSTTKTWVKITSGNTIRYVIDNSDSHDVEITDAAKILSVKAAANETYGTSIIAALYLNTEGKYGYYLAWGRGSDIETSYGSGDPTLWDNFNVVSPLIQVAVFSSTTFMVSFFGTSGANIGGTDVRNVIVNGNNVYDSPSFQDTSLYPERWGVTNAEGKVSVQIINQGAFYANGQITSTSQMAVKYGMRQILEIVVEPHSIPVTINLKKNEREGATNLESIVFPANAKTVVYYRDISFWGKTTTANPIGMTDNNRYYINIYEKNGSTILSNTSLGTGGITPVSGDYTSAQNIKVLPTYETDSDGRQFFAEIKYNDLTNKNNTETPSYTTVKVVDFGGRQSKGITLDNYFSTDISSGAGTGTWSTFSDFTDACSRKQQRVTGSNYFKTINLIYAGGISGSYLAYGNADIPDLSFASLMWYKKGADISYGTNISNYQIDPDISDIYANYSYSYKTEYVEESLKEVDCCMDDGKLYCVGALSNDENTPLPMKLMGLAGTFSAFDTSANKVTYTSSATLNIVYDNDDEENVFPKYFKGMNISIQNHYLRIVYLFKAKKEDTTYLNLVIDSLSVGEGKLGSYLMAGVQSGTNANLQGGVKNFAPTSSNDGFRLIFNNNMLSNIACYENKDYIGSILADWFTVDTEFCIACNGDNLYYKDNNGSLWKLSLVSVSSETWDYHFIEERYIVFNTTKYFNCYDTKTDKLRHWASDYNNRIMFGFGFTSYSNNTVFKALLETQMFNGFMITSQNANYEMTKDTITGLELGAINYSQCLKDYMTFISCGVPYGAVEGIDFYCGEGNSTSAIYVCSYINGLKYTNNDLVNPYAVYPISENGDIRFNPNLFTQFIRSYNNKDMVISDGIAYKLLYYNNVIPVMAYYMLDGVEELVGAFVLQTSYYGVSETRLYQMNYSNGVGVEVVADITNLEYLGALPTQALFWSAQNRAIYSFKGNCIMQLTQYANELTGIYGKWYNPATQELFLDTNIGILVFSDLGTYCLEWDTETNARKVSDIFFFKDKFLINLVDDTTYTYYYSYNRLEGYTSNAIKILTKYYGNGLVPITINNIYIRLYNQHVSADQGTIKFKGYTITDIGMNTDEKTVNIGGETGEQWDTDTYTMLVKYTPQYNRGLGFALDIETTFPIIDIKFDYVESGAVESQISHINI